MRLSVEHIVGETLEAKVEEILGRAYCERGSERGYRNGYRQARLNASEGAVEYAVPRVREAEDASELRAFRELLRGRSDELERLAIEMYARGCSTRDIEAIFGPGMLSKSSVSELTEQLWPEYEAFATWDLSEIRPLYVFLDGLSEPVLVVTDGAAGLIDSVESCWPTVLRQRCLAHKMRNLLGKVPEEIHAEFRTAAKAAFQAPPPKLAQLLREDLVARCGKHYPSAVRSFEEDFQACIAHLQCPLAHRNVIRTTNLLERLFGRERPVLKLMYAVLIRATETWPGIAVTEFEARQLQ